MGEGTNPYAPPVAEVRDAPQAIERELGGRGARLLAAIIDTVVQFAALGVLSFVLPWAVFVRDASVSSLTIGMLTGTVTFLAIQGWLLISRGQSIGKIALGLRIVRPDGSAVTAGRMLGLRYGISFVLGVIPLVNIVWALADSLMIFRESRRCLHDQIADTIVVKA